MGVKVGPQLCPTIVTRCIRHLPPAVRAYIDDLLVGTPPSVGNRHCHVFLGGLDPGQAPLEPLLKQFSFSFRA